MTAEQDAPRVVSASREIAAGPGEIFKLIADPAAQPRWDGNANLAEAADGQLWRWELEAAGTGTRVTHKLQASLDLLAAVAEGS
jgi:uncharacterized protein YndB with AHSA1/START domain